ncbi:hypothetical protein ACP70R_047734 [Stipagrostis hirtigluma subsp. patula]
MALRAAMSHLRSAFSSLRASRTVDLRPLLFLAAEADDPAPRELLLAALEGEVAGIKDWARNLSAAGEGLAAAVAAVSNSGYGRNGLLHIAAALGDDINCATLINVGDHDVDAEIHGVTPLLAAVKGRMPNNVVQVLLEASANVNVTDKYGNSPLHIAIERGYTEAVSLLISHGAAVNTRCESGEYPLQIAVRNRDINMLKLLLEHESIDVNIDTARTALAMAAADGFYDGINCLLEAGANPNIPNENGYVPVEIAASRGYVECVLLLFPVTTPLASYDVWSISAIVSQQETIIHAILKACVEQPDHVLIHEKLLVYISHQIQDFWDAEMDLKSITIGWSKWTCVAEAFDVLGRTRLARKDSSKTSEEEGHQKGVVNFIYANVDKIIPQLGPFTTIALVYSHGERKKQKVGQILSIPDSYFDILCCGTMIAGSSLSLLYSFAAYYKEAPKPSSIGFQMISVLVLLVNCYMLFVMGVTLLGIERTLPPCIVVPGIAMVIVMIVVWPFFLGQPKCVVDFLKRAIDCTKGVNAQRRERLRDATARAQSQV